MIDIFPALKAGDF